MPAGSRTLRSMLVLFALALTGDSAPWFSATAADWPQWRGPTRDGHLPANASLPARLEGEPAVVWRIKVGDGLASPVVAGGKVFHLDNQNGVETLHAVEATTGRTLWSHPLDQAFKDSQSLPGPRCTPLVDGPRVYAQSCRGELHCVDSASGQLVWRIHYVTNLGAVFIGERGQAAGAARHGYNAQPLIEGRQLITVAGGTNGTSLVSLDKATGQVRWKSQDDGAAYAPPIVTTLGGRRQVVAFTVGSLLGLDVAEGSLLWRVPLKTTFGRHVTTPVVVDDTVMVSSHQFGLIGVRVRASGATGQEASVVWTNKEAAINFSSPVTVGRHLYGLGPARNLVCVDAATGQTAWSQEGYFTSSADKAHAGFLATSVRLLILTDGGELVMAAADPGQFREMGRVQVGGQNWCNPAFVDGTLFLRDNRQLSAIRLPQ